MNGRFIGAVSATLLMLSVLAQPAEAKLQVATASIPANILELVGNCAPDVHPNTMAKILGHESGFAPFIIGVNDKGKPRQVFRLKTQQEAAQKARELIAQGKSIDMGLGQIWSGNLKGLKLSPEEIFEPCTNVAAAAGLLMEAYDRALKQGFTDRQAMDQALSVYNTGKFDNGIANGYVSKVRSQRYKVPAMDDEAGEAAAPPAVLQAKPEAPPPAWDVFANARYRGPRPQETETLPATEQQTAAAEQAAVMLFSESR